MIQKTKPILPKDFFKNLWKSSQKSSIKQLKSTDKAKIVKINFNLKIKSNKSKDIIKDPNAQMKKCLPNFIKYFENKIKKRK